MTALLLAAGLLGSGTSVAQETTTYEVHITITDSEGSGIEGICGEVYVFDPEYQSAEVLTDQEGSFQTSVSVDGTHGSTEGHINLRDCDQGRIDALEGYVFDSEWGGYGEQVTLSSDQPTVIEETVLRGAYVVVSAENPEGEELEDCSDYYGPFSPGSRTIHVTWCAGYADMFIGDTRNPEAAEVLDLAEGEVIERAVVLQPMGWLKGTVVDAKTGDPAEDCVRVYERVEGVRGFASQYVPDGTFELGVAAGDAVLEIAECGPGTDFRYVPQFYDGKLTVEDADLIPVEGGKSTTDLDVRLYEEGEGPSTFTDVDSDHDFYTEISWLVDTGVTAGWPDGTFRPTNAVTRQAAVAFLYRLAGEPEGEWKSEFDDVPSDHDFYTEISWAVEQGITTGFPDKTFRPTNPVTRQAAMAFLYRADGAPEGNFTSSFSDVDAEHSFYQEISWGVEEGITGGWPDNTFRPSNDVTRQAIAAFLHRQSN